MLNIFIGLFFVLFNPNINLTDAFSWDLEIGTSDMIVSLLPDFVGYVLIFLGLMSMRGKTVWFKYGEIATSVGFVFSIVDWTCSTLGITLGFVENIFAIIITLALLTILYCITRGIKEIADANNLKLAQFGLRTSFWFLAFFRIFNDAFTASIYLNSFGFGVFLLLVLLFADVIFILRFYKTMKLYYKALNS